MPSPQRVTLTPSERRLATAGQRAMLATEAKALHSLRAVSTDATERLVRAADAAPTRDTARRVVLTQIRPMGDQLRRDIASVVLAARGDARGVAHTRLGAELQAAAKRLPGLPTVPPRADAHEDAARADAAADSYTAAVRMGTVAATLAWAKRDDGSIGAALRQAHALQAHRLRRIAATEVASAYGAEHESGTESLARSVAKLAPFLIKVWDATLDRRLCPVCRGMDGKWAMVGADFTAGRLPGDVHPFCRCTSTLLIFKSALAQFAEGFGAGFVAA